METNAAKISSTVNYDLALLEIAHGNINPTPSHDPVLIETTSGTHETVSSVLSSQLNTKPRSSFDGNYSRTPGSLP